MVPGAPHAQAFRGEPLTPCSPPGRGGMQDAPHHREGHPTLTASLVSFTVTSSGTFDRIALDRVCYKCLDQAARSPKSRPFVNEVVTFERMLDQPKPMAHTAHGRALEGRCGAPCQGSGG